MLAAKCCEKLLVNAAIYPNIVKKFMLAKLPREVSVVHVKMREFGTQCNAITYNTMVDAFAWVRQHGDNLALNSGAHAYHQLHCRTLARAHIAGVLKPAPWAAEACSAHDTVWLRTRSLPAR